MSTRAPSKERKKKPDPAPSKIMKIAKKTRFLFNASETGLLLCNKG
jgi:hypothetical protein